MQFLKQAMHSVGRVCLGPGSALASVAGALAVGLSTPAMAVVYTYDWHGTVDGSVQGQTIFNADSSSTFGVGADLIGQAITVSVKVDTATPGTFYGSLGHSQLSGFGDAVPLSIAITIGGVTYALDEDHFGGGYVVPTEIWSPGHGLIRQGDTYDGYPYTEFGRVTEGLTDVSYIYNRSADSNFFVGDDYSVFDYVNNRFEFFGSGLPAGFGDGSVDTPPQLGTWTLDPYANVSGYFLIQEAHGIGNITSVRDIASASFSFSSVTVTSDGSTGPISAAPEPATWAIMVVGFGLVGGILRSRRLGRPSPRSGERGGRILASLGLRRVGTFAAVCLLAGALPAVGNASVVMNISEVGGNVVASYSGSIDKSGLHLVDNGVMEPYIYGSIASILLGEHNNNIILTGFSGPLSWGTGSIAFGDLPTGDFFGIDSINGYTRVTLPQLYRSGEALSGSATFDSLTLDLLGLNRGQYVYTAAEQTITVNIGGDQALGGVPEPACWALMIAGFGLVGAAMRRRRLRPLVGVLRLAAAAPAGSQAGAQIAEPGVPQFTVSGSPTR